MATEPTKAKRKQSGPRTVKDKVVYMGYKGSFAEGGKPRFFLNPNDAMEAVLSDRDLQVEKVVIPRGKPRKKADDAAAAPTAQAA